MLTGDDATAAAPTWATTVMVSASNAPASTALDVVQLKLAAPTVPTQDQPAPDGVAASVRPVGKRSSTVKVPLLATSPTLRTLNR